jgi:hypothetical protein
MSRKRPHLISGTAPIGKKNAGPAKRFRAKHALGLDPWVPPVRVKKTRQNKNLDA